MTSTSLSTGTSESATESQTSSTRDAGNFPGSYSPTSTPIKTPPIPGYSTILIPGYSSTPIPGYSTTPSSTGTVTPSHTSSTLPHPTRYSAGALAGAIVGSIVGTAILTFLVAFLFFRRRHSAGSSHQQGHPHSQATSSYPQGSGPRSNPTPKADGGLFKSASVVTEKGGRPVGGAAVPVLTAASLVDRYIERPADDAEVIRQVKSLFDNVTLHVENYYSFNSRSAVSNSTLLSRYDSPFLPAPVASLLSNSNRVNSVIKHCLVRTLLTEILPPNPALSLQSNGGSLLPQLYGVYTSPQGCDADQDRLFFYWRMFAAHIYREFFEQQQSFHPTERKARIQSISDTFMTAFEPYATAHHSGPERSRQLVQVISDATELGLWLFRQRCGFEFVWSSDSAGDSIVVFPALWKTFDEEGRRLEAPQTMVKTTLVRL